MASALTEHCVDDCWEQICAELELVFFFLIEHNFVHLAATCSSLIQILSLSSQARGGSKSFAKSVTTFKTFTKAAAVDG